MCEFYFLREWGLDCVTNGGGVVVCANVEWLFDDPLSHRMLGRFRFQEVDGSWSWGRKKSKVGFARNC